MKYPSPPSQGSEFDDESDSPLDQVTPSPARGGNQRPTGQHGAPVSAASHPQTPQEVAASSAATLEDVIGPQPQVKPVTASIPVVPAAGTSAQATDQPAKKRSIFGRISDAIGARPHRLKYDVPPEPSAQLGESASVSDSAATPRHPIQTGFLLTVGVGIALGLYFMLTNVGQLVMWIAVALFIALGLDPIVRWFESRKMPRAVGVLAAMLLLVVVVGGIMGTLIPTIIQQTTQFVENAPTIVADFLKSDFFLTIDEQFHVSTRITDEVNKFFADSAAVGGLFGGVIGVGGMVFNGFFGVLTVLVLAIYFLSSLPAIKAWAYRLAPRSRRPRVQMLSEQITNSVGNYVMGQAIVATINAVYAFIVMSIVGVPYALLLAFVVIILAFIPLVGAVIAGIIVSLIALTVSWQTAVIYAICYFAYLQFEAYFISPRIMQRAVAVPGAVAVIAVIAGGALMGIAGALMAIPLAAAVLLLVREVFIARQDQL
ncbi:putative PurR-regulated permease PerM [Neomicrococcus aestuarii]|uniref:Putative PurR-regulated permease PerM n=1 Tax=Neomicrococcus aestuarii TaxID=556325 RepID=A0A7W8TW08_9MICC|nr:putative PurR-regulated permease PerM [Neomicrococcus aestuarii]